MDLNLLEGIVRLSMLKIHGDWKKTFDSLAVELRKLFIFDNLVIYRAEESNGLVEAVYARATGRGRSKEADVSWGEEIANQVIMEDKAVCQAPGENSNVERTSLPFLLGLPLNLPTGRGALVFVRFGGPQYTQEHCSWALVAANIVMRGFEKATLLESQEQLEKISKKTQLQDDFIAAISHELHTPLGFIKGYATSLLRNDASWDPETQHEFLTIIDEEADHLISLINNVLDSAQMQRGVFFMEFQPVRMDAVIRDAATRIKGRYPQIDIALDLQPTDPIQADAVRLGQVLYNLFDNAIKYAPGSSIEIKLEKGDETQVITFTDQGPGILEIHLPYLFERFYRIPDAAHKRGSGLGLFICKQIIEAHHGTIDVVTAPGKGTRLRIELPEKQKDAQENAAR